MTYGDLSKEQVNLLIDHPNFAKWMDDAQKQMDAAYYAMLRAVDEDIAKEIFK